MGVRLTATLRASLKEFKRKVKEQTKNKTAVAESWLSDNYFFLERIAVNAIAESKRIEKSRFPNVSDALEKCKTVCKDGVLPTADEIVDNFKNSSISTATRLHFSLTCALIIIASEGARLNGKKGEELIAESVKSLRRLEEFDFEYIIHRILVCEELLQRDPAKIYSSLDEYTKNKYRKAIALRAAESGKSEIKVAGDALLTAQKENAHIGKYIIKSEKSKRKGIICLAFEVLMPLASAVAAGILLSNAWAAILLFSVFHPIFKNSVESVFLASTTPKRFLRLKSDDEAVKEVPALITVSVLMPSPDKIKFLEEHLERLHLSNCNGNIKVCCLADFKGANSPSKPEDKVLLKAARDMIDRLNRVHSGGFILAVRPRLYSKTQGEFTGRERKRGAITDLVSAIKGNSKGFIAIHGDKADFEKTKYIIALDADTELEFDGANELIAVAEHPLNRPVISKENGRVTVGYGILVPKAAVKINPFNTRFADIMSGDIGLSSYDLVTNEKYQDLFGEGIFCGKGLIDVEAYYQLMTDALPKETVLSHDIIEGGYLRAGYVSDVHITESFPQTVSSYFMRLHRWIRGDWQNISFIFSKNPMNLLTRYKLFDNLIRSLQPVISLAVLSASIFIEGNQGALIAFAALFSVCAPELFSGISCVLNGGFSALTRRFYSNTIPEAIRFFLRATALIAFWVKQSYITLSAAIKAIWRLFVSKKKLLEWATAAESEKSKSVVRGLISCVPSVVFAIILFAFGSSIHRLIAVYILLDVPLTLILSATRKSQKTKISKKSKELLLGYAASMWRFFDEQCTEKHNFLPPDNIQLSPSRAVAARTSPTNIGLMLLSVLAARDFGFISSEELYRRLDLSVKTIEKLKKFEGNLFNWYNTKTCEVIGERFVSTVDSGNFLCSLVALKEGVKEYAKEFFPLAEIAERAEKLIEETDLTVFYNKNRNLFHIGIFADTQGLSESFYDLYMSEMRTTAYFAVAKRIVSKRHWASPSRIIVKNGGFYGLASWTGTMFEYFMPNIFLPSPKGCLDYESLCFCIKSQRQRAGAKPFGISESGFYAFDGELNYQYKAHGIQNLGLKRDLDREFVVSPYSTFLTLSYAPDLSIRNLKKLEKAGMTGDYGFYEAIDYTAERCSGAKYRIVRSFMAHHVGMSLLSVANLLNNNCVQRRFMRDKSMLGAESLLHERIPRSTAIFKDIYAKKIPEIRERTQRKSKLSENPSIFSPEVTMLSNGRLTVCISDVGTDQTVFDGINVTVPEKDIISRPQGIFAVFTDDEGIKPFVSVLDTEGIGKYKAEFKEDYAIHEARHGFLTLKMQTSIADNRNCEIKKLTVENNSKKNDIKGKIMVYFEPCLEKRRDFSAHPAFSKLFLNDEWNSENECAVFFRNRSSAESSCAVAAGFLNVSPDSHEFSRERVLQTPNGIFSLGLKTDFASKRGNPDCCCALSVEVEVKANKSASFELALATAETREEAINEYITVKSENRKRKTAVSALGKDALDAAIVEKILPEILYNRNSAVKLDKVTIKPMKRESLWSFGISGDNPIILIKLENVQDAASAAPYIRANKTLRNCGIETDIVFVYDKPDGYFGEIKAELRSILAKENCELMLGVKGGIFFVNSRNCAPEQSGYLELAAAIIFKAENNALNTEKIRFKPLRFVSLNRIKKAQKFASRVKKYNFTINKIEIEKESISLDIPWNIVIANKSFGTMVSDKSLGFTWALNSRENKLTPWYNDTMSDNRGEILIMKNNGVLYDLISLSKAIFTPEKAKWETECCGLKFSSTAEVADRGLVKKCKVEIKNISDSPKEFDISYYILPVLGTGNNSACRFTVKKLINGAVIGSTSGEIPGIAALQCEGKADYICFSRHDFWEGKLNSDKNSENDFCVAVGRKISLAVGGTTSFSFYLSWGACEKAALKMPAVSSFGAEKQNVLKIPDSFGSLALFCNSFLYHQVLKSRFFGKTGFYQCSGAFGFRDQLQDCLAIVYNNPSLVRTHIIRCSAVQFEDGDVLHWWHVLVDKSQIIKGVRTCCSDDMLWLPFVCADYITKTGDNGILSVQVPYIKGDKLRAGEKERYIIPERTANKGTVFEHCIRAIEKSLNFGVNGLPLIGSCDWNDGFSNIGDENSGESVWLAMFQITVLKKFADVCSLMNENERRKNYIRLADELEEKINRVAWRQNHYLRAIMKDGSALGGDDFVDILPQAFSVFAEFKDKARVKTALLTAYEVLFDEKNGIIRLFNKPFTHDEIEKVGYIARYPEGIRENSGQYTHAAVWLASAMLKFGEKEKGKKLLDAINPMSFYSDEVKGERYRAEPYVLSADISYGENIIGRAGWSHFTGSAAWLYKCVIEELSENETKA